MFPFASFTTISVSPDAFGSNFNIFPSKVGVTKLFCCPSAILKAPWFSPVIVTLCDEPPTYKVTFLLFASIVLSFTSTFTVVFWFPFVSLRTTLVVPTPPGYIVSILPLIFAVATVSFG